MSLFQCDNCGCRENTALSSQGCNGFFEKLFDWSYAPERKGMRLCSACAPVQYRDGNSTELGEWHGVFPRVYLPKGMFITNGVKVLCFPVEDEPIHASFNGQLWLQDISWSVSDESIDNVISCNVTHWQPLPAAPKEVG